MKNMTIGFIGGGNMARSLIGGLINSGMPPASIHVYDIDETCLQQLHGDLNITTQDSNQAVIDQAEVIVLAIKPQVMKPVISSITPPSVANKLLLSIAAGIQTTAIQRWVGLECAIVRAMPNTPALVQSGATGLYANPQVSDEQKDLAESILRAVGLTLWVDDEAQLDAVTALSGSGPAYFFLVMEAMEQAGRQLGLSAEAARLLTVQTAFGASKLALEIEEDPAVLRQRVTSPGGTTEKAIQVLQQQQLAAIFEQALTAARDRAVELAEQLGQ